MTALDELSALIHHPDLHFRQVELEAWARRWVDTAGSATAVDRLVLAAAKDPEGMLKHFIMRTGAQLGAFLAREPGALHRDEGPNEDGSYTILWRLQVLRAEPKGEPDGASSR